MQVICVLKSLTQGSYQQENIQQAPQKWEIVKLWQKMWQNTMHELSQRRYTVPAISLQSNLRCIFTHVSQPVWLHAAVRTIITLSPNVLLRTKFQSWASRQWLYSFTPRILVLRAHSYSAILSYSVCIKSPYSRSVLCLLHTRIPHLWLAGLPEIEKCGILSTKWEWWWDVSRLWGLTKRCNF